VRPAQDKRPSGLPIRNSEGRAVPHGQPGERNRKFVKPQTPNDPRPVTPARYQDRAGSDDRDPRPGRFEADRPRPYSPAPRPGKHDAKANGNRGFGSDRRKPEDRSYDNRVREERRQAGGWQPERIFQQQRENRPGRGGYPQQSVDFERGVDRNDAPRRTAGGERGPRSWADRRFGAADRSSQFEAPTYNLKKFSNDRGGASRPKKRTGDEYSEPKEGIRLNRYIANAGVCSRREADALIAAGEIRVNGEIVMEMGYIVKPEDSVQYGKRSLKREKLVYVLLNKPKDHITTTDDPEERKTVMDLVGNASKERIFPVGRLDRNTTGLLLFTNDGELAQKLTHPSHRMQKIYQVELDKALSSDHFAQIQAGLMLEDGKIEIDDIAVVNGNERFVGIELHSGRNRIVRRIFEHLGYDVVALDRVQYAGLTKKDLPRGNWRYLTQQEVVRLKFIQ
jgi:23S rRNA pseudouridine2605 synthase